MKLNSTTFYGHEVSEYGLENNRVDYATLAKSFNSILNNDIMKHSDYWTTVNGSEIYFDLDGERLTPEEADEKREELESRRAELETADLADPEEAAAIEEEIAEINEQLEDLQTEYYNEYFQFYIIDAAGAEILQTWTNETVFYSDYLDMYVWGVTHYGTSWTHVLTDIEIDK